MSSASWRPSPVITQYDWVASPNQITRCRWRAWITAALACSWENSAR
ncbi:hypothetical protein [Nocardiopsis sp. CNR-923]|nr:hypothetical protein [Nocardiopsis sp. CNR-923]